MRFRDDRSWGLWGSTLVVIPVCCYLARRCCQRIANDPSCMIGMFVAILAVMLVSQVFIGVSIWRLLDTQSEYEINGTGFRSRKYALKKWHQVTWEELPYHGVFRRWGLKRCVYFSNYPFDGKRMQGPLNDASAKRILFILPFSRRGKQAIQRYCPDKRQNLGV